MDDNRITYFGETDARNRKVKFGIKAKDRTRHVYVIGKTGMGKSTLLENMAVQDIMNGEGMAFIDPHGKTADLLLEYVPEHRLKDVVYFAPFDTEYPISFNVLESVDADKRHLVVAGLMSTFKKIWQDAWSARMEYILTNTLLALLEYPDSTLLGVNRMLSDATYRKKVVDNVKDPSVKAFWVEEFAKYTERMAAEAVPAIQNKIGQFTANALIRNMIGQPRSSFNIRRMMDEGKIMIINLSKGRIGEANANLLGGMLITKIYLAAMSRADVPDRVLKTLPNFYLFVDEFQNFANESFADILSEARKYKLNLTIAHQYIEQMEEEVRAAVFGNVGTMITFRVGAYDAEVLEKEFSPQFTGEDIVNLGFAQIYLKLMIDGISSAPFSATTLPPIPNTQSSLVDKVKEMSRQQFASPREVVEQAIVDWHAPMTPQPAAKKKPEGFNPPSRSGESRPQQSAPKPAIPNPAAAFAKIDLTQKPITQAPAPEPTPEPAEIVQARAPKQEVEIVEEKIPERPAPQKGSSLGLGSLIKHVEETQTQEIEVREARPPHVEQEASEPHLFGKQENRRENKQYNTRRLVRPPMTPERMMARLGPDAAEAQGLILEETTVNSPKGTAPKVEKSEQNSANNTQKIATKRNVDGLKSALAALVPKAPEQTGNETPKIKPVSEKPVIQMKKKEEGTLIQPTEAKKETRGTSQSKAESKPEQPKQTPPTEPTPQEVPQNVLEELLRVEK